jgi:hypothetical protein
MKPRWLPVVAMSLFACCAVVCASPTAHLLTAAQVAKLADAHAVAERYDLRHYTRGMPEYDAHTGEWSVFYVGRSQVDHGRPTLPVGDHFTVYVADMTKHTRIIRGR